MLWVYSVNSPFFYGSKVQILPIIEYVFFTSTFRNLGKTLGDLSKSQVTLGDPVRPHFIQ